MTEIISGLADELSMTISRVPAHRSVDWGAIQIGDGFKVEVRDYASARVMAYRKSLELGRRFRSKKKGNQIFIVRTA